MGWPARWSALELLAKEKSLRSHFDTRAATLFCLLLRFSAVFLCTWVRELASFWGTKLALLLLPWGLYFLVHMSIALHSRALILPVFHMTT
jgi:hypothetical protein